MYELHTIGTIL